MQQGTTDFMPTWTVDQYSISSTHKPMQCAVFHVLHQTCSKHEAHPESSLLLNHTFQLVLPVHDLISFYTANCLAFVCNSHHLDIWKNSTSSSSGIALIVAIFRLIAQLETSSRTANLHVRMIFVSSILCFSVKGQTSHETKGWLVILSHHHYMVATFQKSEMLCTCYWNTSANKINVHSVYLIC